MSLSCGEFRELAPELALGLLAGPDRAAALEHLASCADCRSYMDGLSRAADALGFLGPESEPPAGFEARVLARMQRPARGPARRWVAAVLAAAVVAGVAAWTASAAVYAPDRRTREYVAALEVLGGRSLRAARLVSVEGRVAGHVFVYEGRPSWYFLDVDDGDENAIYRIDLEMTDGRSVDAGGVRVKNGIGSWGETIAVDVDSIRSVRVLDRSGAKRYEARFSSH